MGVMKEAGAKWLVEMAEYISDNPLIIVNGFIRSGITSAADGLNTDECDKEQSSSTEEDSSNEYSSEEYEDDFSDYEDDF